MSDSQQNAAPGSCFRFVVDSAQHAAEVIRAQLGADARVLSVRSVPARGIRRFWSSPRLEVIAQVGDPGSDIEAAGEIDAPTGSTSGDSTGPVACAVQPIGVSSEAALPAGLDNSPPGNGGASPDGVPLRPMSLSALLRRSGLSEMLVARLEISPEWRRLRDLPLHAALVETGRILRRRAEARPESAPLSRAAFLGAPGVGRTTALCKWLAAEVFRRGRMGHVVVTEFDRPNSPGPLPVFCEALGVPLAHFPASTVPVTPGGFVYFDLPGMSVRDPAANAPLAAFLDSEKIVQRVLVLNAAYDPVALRAAYAAGRSLAATHVVFTHLDEVPQWGRLWDFLPDGGLEPLFLGTGPSLTGDDEEDVIGALIRRTLPACETSEDVRRLPAGEDDEDSDAA